MSYAYNKAKKKRRVSWRKHGHVTRAGDHQRRPTFGEKIRAWFARSKS
jgi:hypothetical protein